MESAFAKRFRWTVKRYFRASQMGVFGERRVELLNGEIISMPAQEVPHRLSVSRITRLLVAAFDPAQYWVVVQGTVKLTRLSAPDPDFHVLNVPEQTPTSRLPLPFLLIEVSDTTYRKDKGPKLRTYASVGIPDYWIVNLPGRKVEVHRQPVNETGRWSGWTYKSVSILDPGDQASPLLRPDLSFPVDRMLP